MPNVGAPIILLHGAVKNAGDFLIANRAKRLLEHVHPTTTIRRWDRRDFLSDDMIEGGAALVLAGGPALASNAFESVYSLDPQTIHGERLIVPLGVGWSGYGSESAFRFSESTRAALVEIHRRVPRSGVRDSITLRLLQGMGVENTIVSGCPAWYDLDFVESDLREPPDIRQIVVTSPARPPHFVEAVRLLSRLADKFVQAEFSLVFHRGIGFDRNSNILRSFLDQAMAVFARASRIRVVDASYSSDQLERYGEYDLHVGYRVHAHIGFLSQRKPSILIHEDGRGLGQTLTLGSRGVALERSGVEAIVAAVMAELDEGFSGSRHAIKVMRRTFPSMLEIVRTAHP